MIVTNQKGLINPFSFIHIQVLYIFYFNKFKSKHYKRREEKERKELPTIPIMESQSNRIPRPRNAFMIFRAQFSNNNKISKDVEHDHRQISRIVGHCWNKMSEEEKQVWRDKAHQEKLEHMQKYPNYRFTPLTRTKKPLKRNTKRNSEEDMQRCRRVADLLLQGKQGDELVAAVNTVPPSFEPPSPSLCQVPQYYTRDPNSTPPFRSPLLPPSDPLPIVNENIPSSPVCC